MLLHYIVSIGSLPSGFHHTLQYVEHLLLSKLCPDLHHALQYAEHILVNGTQGLAKPYHSGQYVGTSYSEYRILPLWLSSHTTIG